MVANVAPGLRALGAVRCLLLAALAAPLAAQDSVVIVPDAPACATCSLDISAVVELGDREGPGIVAQLNAPYALARVVRSDDGDYYVPGYLGDGRLLRFSSDGVFQEAIGRRGVGPGEYDLPVLVGGSADDLTILDVLSPRLTTIRGGEVATWRLPFRFDGLDVFPTAGTCTTPSHPSPIESGILSTCMIRRADKSRALLATREFAPPEWTRASRNCGAALQQRWTETSGRRAATATGSTNGAPMGITSRESSATRPGFGRGKSGSAWTTKSGPCRRSWVCGDWGDGLLMVVMRVADADWQPLTPTLEPVPGHATIEPTQGDELYDTVIEVLDTRSGTVLARTRVDERVVGLVGRDGFCTYAEHSDLGEPKYVVWSVALLGYSG